MRVGILTGGGDCASLNAAIHGVARNLLQEGAAELIGIEDGFLGLIEERSRPIHASDLEGLMHEGGTILGTCNKASPFAYQGQNRVQQVTGYYRSLGLDCIVALGGDGTMSLCHELSQHGLKFVGVPKTIDNDLMHTDRSFGFDTAVNIVAEAIDRLQSTGKSHHRVMIVETMGRYAGWIALYGGVAGDADVILLPEYPYDLDEVVAVVREREQHHQHTIIVVAEGATPRAGERQVNQTVADSPDPVRLGGIAKLLQKQLEHQIDSEVRITVLGHVQRGGPPTAFDRIFASNLGCYAAELVRRRQFGSMVSIQNGRFHSVALEEVAHQVRTVPVDDMTLFNALRSGISLGQKELVQLWRQRDLASLQMH